MSLVCPRCGGSVSGVATEHVCDPFAKLAYKSSGNTQPALAIEETRASAPGTLAGVSGFIKPTKTAQEDVQKFIDFGDPEKEDPNFDRLTRKSQVDHNERTRNHWEADGWHCDRVDGWMSKGQGVFVKKDFLGLFDCVASKPGKKLVLIQICSADKKAISKHLAAMCSDKPAPDNKKPRLENLRWMMGCGFVCCLHAWSQPGGFGSKWAGEVIIITEEMIEGVISRRRKK